MKWNPTQRPCSSNLSRSSSSVGSPRPNSSSGLLVGRPWRRALQPHIHVLTTPSLCIPDPTQHSRQPCTSYKVSSLSPQWPTLMFRAILLQLSYEGSWPPSTIHNHHNQNSFGNTNNPYAFNLPQNPLAAAILLGNPLYQSPPFGFLLPTITFIALPKSRHEMGDYTIPTSTLRPIFAMSKNQPV